MHRYPRALQIGAPQIMGRPQARFFGFCLSFGAAPDAQARGRGAIAVDVVGDAFLLEQYGDALGYRGLIVGAQGGEIGIGDLEAYRGVGAVFRMWADPDRGTGSVLRSVTAIREGHGSACRCAVVGQSAGLKPGIVALALRKAGVMWETAIEVGRVVETS